MTGSIVEHVLICMIIPSFFHKLKHPRNSSLSLTFQNGNWGAESADSVGLSLACVVTMRPQPARGETKLGLGLGPGRGARCERWPRHGRPDAAVVIVPLQNEDSASAKNHRLPPDDAESWRGEDRGQHTKLRDEVRPVWKTGVRPILPPSRSDLA